MTCSCIRKAARRTNNWRTIERNAVCGRSPNPVLIRRRHRRRPRKRQALRSRQTRNPWPPRGPNTCGPRVPASRVETIAWNNIADRLSRPWHGAAGRRSRGRAGQRAPEGGDDGRLRPADRRHGLIVLPPASEALVELHELLALGYLSLRVLLLQIVELPLGIDDVQKIRQSAVVPRGRQIDGALARHHGSTQILETRLLCLIGIERSIHLLHGAQNCLAVIDQAGTSLQVGNVDFRIDCAKVEQGPHRSRPERPNVLAHARGGSPSLPLAADRTDQGYSRK